MAGLRLGDCDGIFRTEDGLVGEGRVNGPACMHAELEQGYGPNAPLTLFLSLTGWTRYPIDRLCTEVALSSDGEPEAPDLVAERARLVFTTLERVHPQFPSV